MLYGADILASAGMQAEKAFIQHAQISCYEHSVHVAAMSVRIAWLFRLRLNMRSLVRGALLHDYFLYDWHEADPGHRLHGFFHARRALANAERDFTLNAIERDIIARHMFPLNPKCPKFRESAVVCLADKICALCEILRVDLPSEMAAKSRQLCNS